MSQGFRSRYDEMRDNNPADDKKPEKKEAGLYYTGISHTRSLCLLMADGKRHFFNYAYLISGEFEVHRDINVIRLNFASFTVELSGYALEELFMTMLEHSARIVTLLDARYVISLSANEPAVLTMQVHTKE